MAVDIRTWSIFDKIAAGAGAVIFIFSFISSFVTVSYNIAGFGGGSVGISAWNSYATLGLLLMFAAVALVVLRTMQPAVLPDTVPWPLVTVGAAGLGLLLVVLRAFTYSGGGVGGGSIHPGWSGWVLMLAGLVLVAATAIPLTAYKDSVEGRLTKVSPPSVD